MYIQVNISERLVLEELLSRGRATAGPGMPQACSRALRVGRVMVAEVHGGVVKKGITDVCVSVCIYIHVHNSIYYVVYNIQFQYN